MSVDDAYTKSLLHFEGADASTAFADESGKAWTANGNVQIDTAQLKFGGSSGLFDGNGDFITTPYSGDFDVGAGDFTVDLWVRLVSAATGQFYSHSSEVNAGANTTMYIGRDSGADRLRCTIGYSGGLIAIYGTTTFTAMIGNWVHIAYERYGNVLSGFVNGTKEANGSASGLTVSTVNFPPRLGCFYSSGANLAYLNGWMDEFRFSKGIARYQGNNFIPRSSPYSGVSKNYLQDRGRDRINLRPISKG